MEGWRRGEGGRWREQRRFGKKLFLRASGPSERLQNHGGLRSRRPFLLRPQVPEAVEELREAAPPAGQQPQGQTAGQAEADAEGGGCCSSSILLMILILPLAPPPPGPLLQLQALLFLRLIVIKDNVDEFAAQLKRLGRSRQPRVRGSLASQPELCMEIQVPPELMMSRNSGLNLPGPSGRPAKTAG